MRVVRVLLATLTLCLSVPTAANAYMLMDAERLANLPTTGAPYEKMKATADNALETMDLTEPASGESPWLPNYSPRWTGVGKGAATMSAALMYVKTHDERYRDFVIRVNRFVMGSEMSNPNDNDTDILDKTLATNRQISAYVLAADLVDMDRHVTGSRAGWTNVEWEAWLSELRTKVLPGAVNNKKTMMMNTLMATNHSTWAFAALSTINSYLHDEAGMSYIVDRIKLYLGETMTGTPWNQSTAYDGTWKCVPEGSGVVFIPVNPADCGPAKDGVIVEDASRSAFPFPTHDKTGNDYQFHAYNAMQVASIVLDRQGYDVWNWGNKAMKRIMDQFNRRGIATGNGRTTMTQVSWVTKYFYDEDYPTLPANAGDVLLATDWLYGPVVEPPTCP